MCYEITVFSRFFVFYKDDTARQRFDELKKSHDDLVEELQIKQQELQDISSKKQALEDVSILGLKLSLFFMNFQELAVSPLKQEASRTKLQNEKHTWICKFLVVLHEKLAELRVKRESIQNEITAEGTPDQQRERLLAKVKSDNQDIAAFDKQ